MKQNKSARTQPPFRNRIVLFRPTVNDEAENNGRIDDRWRHDMWLRFCSGTRVSNTDSQLYAFGASVHPDSESSKLKTSTRYARFRQRSSSLHIAVHPLFRQAAESSDHSVQVVVTCMNAIMYIMFFSAREATNNHRERTHPRVRGVVLLLKKQRE